MKRVFIICTCMMLLLVGCSKQISLEGKENDLVNAVLAMDGMDKLKYNEHYDIFFEVEDGVKVIDYVATTVSANEIAVFTCKDAEQVTRTEAVIKSYLSGKEESVRLYEAGEADKLKNALIKIKGNCIVLCVTDNNDEVLKEVNKYKN